LGQARGRASGHARFMRSDVMRSFHSYRDSGGQGACRAQAFPANFRWRRSDQTHAIFGMIVFPVARAFHPVFVLPFKRELIRLFRWRVGALGQVSQNLFVSSLSGIRPKIIHTKREMRPWPREIYVDKAGIPSSQRDSNSKSGRKSHKSC
jgi:hypothetical protein